MVPLTDATVAYVVNGILEVVDASTLIINRELASWYREADEATNPGLISYAKRPAWSLPQGLIKQRTENRAPDLVAAEGGGEQGSERT